MTSSSHPLYAPLCALRTALLAHEPDGVEVVITLGSGLSQVADHLALSHQRVIPYASLPHLPTPTVEGHCGELILGQSVDGLRVAVMRGRSHFYEGHDWPDVLMLLRGLAMTGVRGLIVTNAAGSLRPEWPLGGWMRLTDQLNFTGHHPLRGPNPDFLGPRFFDMSQAFCPHWGEAVYGRALAQGVALQQGVYAGVMGPSYETPAEVRALARLGADAVGMSTVAEVLAARHMGMKVLGFSCLTNLAAGLGNTPLNHAEVTTTGALPKTQDHLLTLLHEALATYTP
jgi:purine-nucleoside phosphorylase